MSPWRNMNVLLYRGIDRMLQDTIKSHDVLTSWHHDVMLHHSHLVSGDCRIHHFMVQSCVTVSHIWRCFIYEIRSWVFIIGKQHGRKTKVRRKKIKWISTGRKARWGGWSSYRVSKVQLWRSTRNKKCACWHSAASLRFMFLILRQSCVVPTL